MKNIPDKPDNTDAVAEPNKKRAHRNPFRSIRVRTFVINIAYALAILVMLWTLFFVFLFWFYGGQLRADLGNLGKRVSETFPHRVDDKALEQYKHVVSEAARDRTVSISAFTESADGYDIIFNIDTFGNNIEQSTEAFAEFMSQLDVSMFGSGEVYTIDTRIGDYICYCVANEIVTDSGLDTAYILVVRQYELFSPTIVSIIYALVVCSAVALGLSVLTSFILSGSQTKRIKDISTKARQLADGDYSVVFSGGGSDEYNDLATALNLATAEMNKTEALRRDMIANISHDIRTPLTMIRGYAEMIRDMPLDEQKRERMTNIIIDETDRLNALSGDVLSLSKLQAGVVEFEYERVNISKIAHSALAKFDIFSERDGIKFVCDIDDGAYAVCDAQRIMQVLYNFIGNAINYCGDDKTVTLAVKKTDDGVHVEIGDHGEGIAPDELDSVWYKYYRAAQSKRTAVGTGLGLSICKNVLDGHGAQYSVKSELGKGTVFSFDLKDRPSPTNADEELFADNA